MRTFIIFPLGALCLVACTVGAPLSPTLYRGRLLPDTLVDLDGTFTFSAQGELSLALTMPCTMVTTLSTMITTLSTIRRGTTTYHGEPCDRVHLDMIDIAAKTPWHTRVPGKWTDASHLVFRVDWRDSGLDLLDVDDAVAKARLPWMILNSTSVFWKPNELDALRILGSISKATDTDVDVIAGGPAPELEVTKVDTEDGSVRAGVASTVVVGIANHGPGAAYRVIATIRSGVLSLHGKRIAFGKVMPGTEKVRRIRLTVPATEPEADAMLVIAVHDANGFSAQPFSRRVSIAAALIAPLLTMHCSIPGRNMSRPDLDSGEQVTLHCVVRNLGTCAAKVELETSVNAEDPLQWPVERILPAAQATFDVQIHIPRGLALDSAVKIKIAARDRGFARDAHTVLVGVIRKPKLCAPGELTHAQYRVKLDGLRSALAAGELTQAQFDGYDAELVSCLNVN